MSSASAQPASPLPQEPSVPAAILSYLIPGLGQISQGRNGKGVLFMVSLLGMFFLGQAMGNWQNVYLYRKPEQGRNVLSALLVRWHYAGQFWIGVAAWPALWQFFDLPIPKKEEHPFLHNFQKTPDERDLNRFLVTQDKTPDLGWVYTVIAGMLNILVIYDAYAGAVFPARPKASAKPAPQEVKQEGAV